MIHKTWIIGSRTRESRNCWTSIMLSYPDKMKIKLNRKYVLFGYREHAKRVMTAGFCMSMTKINSHLVGSFRRMDIVTRAMSACSSMRDRPRILISRLPIWLMDMNLAHIMSAVFVQKVQNADCLSSISLSKLTSKFLARERYARIIQLAFAHLVQHAS